MNMQKNGETKAVCTGACLFGKCPHKVCIRHAQKERQAVQVKAGLNIMTKTALPDMAYDKKGIGAAVDIGTTTVVVYFYDCANGRKIGHISRLNAQATIGVDVISRIQYCTEQQHGLELLNEAIITELNDLFKTLADQNDIDIQAIEHVVITGNTTMLHLLAKISPSKMGVSPFEAASLFGQYYKAKELGLNCENAKAYLTPCISAFVGGDITSAIIASGMKGSGKLCVLLDIGTNGEVALGDKNVIFATSTAAGPAFEGAHISCGMAGVPGAINSVKAYKGDLEITTIGEAAQKGICGSGLLDAVALMLNIGLIDETGRILDASEAKPDLKNYLTQAGGQPALKISEGIVLTQKDIREVQMAKAAVAAGLLALLHHAQKDIRDVDTFFLAGGFGNFLDPQSAIRVGLLPKEAEGKIKPIGNAAGTGAVMMLLNDEYIHEGEKAAGRGEHVELGDNKYFMDQYVKNMMF